MKIQVLAISFCLLAVSLLSCQEDKKGPLKAGSETPMPVTGVSVENLSGAARISYVLPDDPNLVCVEASYRHAGQDRLCISSAYQCSVLIEGLSETTEQVVKLTTVNKFNNRSQSVEAKIQPLTAPIFDIFKTFKVNTDFGGIFYRMKNAAKEKYIVNTLVKDSLGVWVNYDRYYTPQEVDVQNVVRGLPPIPTSFGVFLEDAWQNKTDTAFFDLTPLYEEFFDKNLWRMYKLPDDSVTPRYKDLSQLWTDKDGVLTMTTYFFMSPKMPGLTLPNWFTIDLGAEYKFGRMKVFNVQHSSFWRYANGTPKEFEIWGTNTPSVNWADWTRLGTFECVKPSGSPAGVVTDSDIVHMKEGDDYDFPPQDEDAYYRYVRFKTLSTFGSNPDVYILELAFWGQKKQE